MKTSDPFEKARSSFMAGLQAHTAGDLAMAERCFRESLQWLPGRASTLLNLGVTLLQQGRAPEAAQHLTHSLAVEAGQPDALFHLGAALAEMGQVPEGMARIDEALAIDPRPAKAWFFRAQCLLHLEHLDDALKACDESLVRDPALGAAHHLRGDIQRQLGDGPGAIASYRQSIELGHDVESSRFLLSAVGADPPPAAPPRTYVERLFDDYARQFDEHLVEALQYDAPQRLAGLLRPMRRPGETWRALDLGCGTGLCGQALRGLVSVIDGVDLSASMLERARARAVYRQLVHADVHEHLSLVQAGTYDLLIAADVLIYIGDIERLMALARRALRPGGLFALTAESMEASQPGAVTDRGYHLHDHARYAHRSAYLELQARQAGFECVVMQKQALRREQQRVVPALYVLLRASDAAAPVPTAGC